MLFSDRQNQRSTTARSTKCHKFFHILQFLLILIFIIFQSLKYINRTPLPLLLGLFSPLFLGYGWKWNDYIMVSDSVNFYSPKPMVLKLWWKTNKNIMPGFLHKKTYIGTLLFLAIGLFFPFRLSFFFLYHSSFDFWLSFVDSSSLFLSLPKVLSR